MPRADAVHASTTDRGESPSWQWATALAVQPVLTTGVFVGTLLFGFVSTTTTALALPEYRPLVPGAATLAFLGLAYLYTPIYVVGLALDRRYVRATEGVWDPSRSVLLGGGIQIIYFTVPIVQAYGGETFEELVFGSVEFAALLCTGVITIRYLAVRDSNLPESPALVSLWSGVWSRVTRE